MRAASDDHGTEAAKCLSLEAEVAAWRSKRSGRPETVAGKVPVVRIGRRARPGSLTNRMLQASTR
jgi:hypothetical protein